MNKKHTLLAAMLVMSGSCFALELSAPTLNTALALTFPMEVKGFHIKNPKLELSSGNAVFCGTAQPKLLPKNIDFCTSFVPQWHQETGSLHASKMAITSLQVDGVSSGKADAARGMVNKSVLPVIDGLRIYQSNSWIGKQVSSVKVMPGKVALSF